MDMGGWVTCRVISLCCLLFFGNVSYEILCEELQIREAVENDYKYVEPTVMIAVLVRNKAHVLPWFFGHLEKLNYPKNRISFW